MRILLLCPLSLPLHHLLASGLHAAGELLAFSFLLPDSTQPTIKRRRENPDLDLQVSPAQHREPSQYMAGIKGDGNSLVLLDVFDSPYAQRVHVALAEKGQAYERAEQDLATKSDLLHRSNPVHGKVTVLLHDGRPVYKSLAIIQYLNEVVPAPTPS